MKQGIAVESPYLSLRQGVAAAWRVQGLHTGRASACGRIVCLRIPRGRRVRPAGAKLAQVRVHFLAQGVVRQKTPEYLVVVDALPRSPLGKVQKMTLRKQILNMVVPISPGK